MKRMCVILMALAVSGFATPAPAQEKKAEAKIVLPGVVAKAVNDNCPNAEIGKVDMEKEAGISLYDVEFKAGRGEIEVAEDGTVMEITTIVEIKDIPPAAAAAIQKAAKGATLKELERAEIRAEVKKGGKGRIVKLDNPTLAYEAELVKGNRRGEIQVAPDGRIVEALKWRNRSVKKD